MNSLYFVLHQKIYCPNCTPRPPQGRNMEMDEVASPVFEDACPSADAPRHCAGCAAFIKTPLTDKGVTHVVEQLRDFDPDNANADTLTTWAHHYQDQIQHHPDVDILIRQGFHAVYIFLDDKDRELQLLNDLRDCALPGDAEPAVRYVLDTYRIIASPDIRTDLQQAGYDPDDLTDHQHNIERFIWNLGGEIRDNENWFALND